MTNKYRVIVREYSNRYEIGLETQCKNDWNIYYTYADTKTYFKQIFKDSITSWLFLHLFNITPKKRTESIKKELTEKMCEIKKQDEEDAELDIIKNEKILNDSCCIKK